jgi:hypothetical protein
VAVIWFLAAGIAFVVSIILIGICAAMELWDMLARRLGFMRPPVPRRPRRKKPASRRTQSARR